MAFDLPTPATVRKLQALIARMDNSDSGDMEQRPHESSLQVAIVQCGELVDTGIYEGTINLLQASDLTYIEADLPVYLTEANDSPLETSKYYLAFGYGEYDNEDDIRRTFVTHIGNGGDSGIFMKVTGSTGTTDLYFANAATIDPFFTWTDGGAGLLYDANHEGLVTGRYYRAWETGIYVLDGTPYVAYVTTNVEAETITPDTCVKVMTNWSCDANVPVLTFKWLSLPADWIHETSSACEDFIS